MGARGGALRWRRGVATLGAACALIGLGVIAAERYLPAHAVAATHGSASPSAAASTTPASPSPSPTVSANPACEQGADSVYSVPDASAPGGRRSVWVHRPAGPDNANIPVLYLLHGYPQDPTDLFSGTVAQLLDQEMCHTGQPFVFAVPDGRSENIDTEWGDDASGRFAIESFVTRSVIQLVEGNQQRPAQLRAIAGFSMGGYGAAAIALRHPGEYRQIASFGGYFHVDDPDNVFGDDSDPHAPDQIVSAGVGQRYFLVEGADEDTPLLSGSIHGEADRFSSLLRGYGITVSVSHPPGGHTGQAWYPQVAPMVDFFETGWAASGS